MSLETREDLDPVGEVIDHLVENRLRPDEIPELAQEVTILLFVFGLSTAAEDGVF